ncbi:MAG: maleylpyruvate isomerase family mycothiol-dependent enzyme [Nocardioides sp.]
MPTAPLPQIDEMALATARYRQALTVLDDARLHEPSLLPDWTRGHVTAHLAGHARACVRALALVAGGQPGWLYPSQEERDGEIEAAAGRTADEVRAEADQVLPALEQALRAVHADHLDAPISRLPGGPAFFTPRALPGVRRTEVEVHHADLGVGYGPEDWPADFGVGVVGRRQAELGLDGPSMVLRATDCGEVWKLGSGAGPDVTGTAGALAWWLVGRGDGAGLTSSTGELPRLGRWR